MIPFHKLAIIERDLLKDPRLRPITIGALLCRFFVRTVLRIKRKGIADRLLKDKQLSYWIPCGVQMVNMGCTIATRVGISWSWTTPTLTRIASEGTSGRNWKGKRSSIS
jgi:hypothetical protein